MSTSKLTIALEVAAGAVLATGCVALGSPGDVWLTGVGLHPAWIAVLALSARYGTLGLLLALGMTGAALSGTSLALGGSLAGLSARAASSPDLCALAASIVVAWIAMLHEKRRSLVAARLAVAEQHGRAADDTVAAMLESVGRLRARHDRLDMSLSLWRDVAGRLERGDAAEAARAALELCAIRSGANAGVVHSWDGTSLHALAWHGQWSPSDPRPRDIFPDRTAAAAVARRRPTAASEVEGSEIEDGDVAVPILDGSGGRVLGVIALRGVTPDRLRAADLHDIVLLAQWLAPALARSTHLPRLRAATEATAP